MNLQSRYNNTELLSLNELGQLSADVLAELEEVGYPHRDLAAWYLRNKCYLPYSLVAELVGYSTAEKAARADQDLRWQCESGMVSLWGKYTDTIAKLESLARNFYGLGGNTLLERAGSDLFEDAVLFEASRITGYRDNRRNGQWFKPTPKYSVLTNYMELTSAVSEGEDLERALSDFNITSNI
jgi:hypothetical protein